MLVDFGWLIGSYLFGIMLGCLTGLIPEIGRAHV